jgi:GH24 family phage-related lysozyme (muramidase)
MQTSTAGRAAIARREGTKLVAYQDSGGVLTIGTGHTSAAGAPHVTAGMGITAAEADQILSRDLAATEAAVTKAVHVPLAQHEFDALVSLAFNIGAGAFARRRWSRSSTPVTGRAPPISSWSGTRMAARSSRVSSTVGETSERSSSDRMAICPPCPQAAP